MPAEGTRSPGKKGWGDVGSSLKLGIILTSVELLHLNHYYDKSGKHVFDQTIIMEKDPSTGKMHTRAWLMADDSQETNRRPTKNGMTGQWEVYWYDHDKRVARKITSRAFHESWSQIDPEREDKKTWPEEWRAALPSPIKQEDE